MIKLWITNYSPEDGSIAVIYKDKNMGSLFFENHTCTLDENQERELLNVLNMSLQDRVNEDNG